MSDIETRLARFAEDPWRAEKVALAAGAFALLANAGIAKDLLARQPDGLKRTSHEFRLAVIAARVAEATLSALANEKPSASSASAARDADDETPF